MTTVLDLVRPGDIGFMGMAGGVGVFVEQAQRWVDRSTPEERKIRHVLVVTDTADQDSGWPLAVQAMPHGAEEIRLTPGRHGDVIFIRPYYGYSQGERVAAAARGYIGAPYSFLDYAAIAGRHALALKPTQRTLFDRYVSATGHMICSQLADQCLSDAGWHVFDDGRISQDVTPVALYRQMLLMPHTIVGAS